MKNNLAPHNLQPTTYLDGEGENTSNDAPHPQLVAAARLLVRWLLDTLQNAPEEVALVGGGDHDDKA